MKKNYFIFFNIFIIRYLSEKKVFLRRTLALYSNPGSKIANGFVKERITIVNAIEEDIDLMLLVYALTGGVGSESVGLVRSRMGEFAGEGC